MRVCLQRCVTSVLLLCTALWACACAVPLGPGYNVQKQEIGVRFEASINPVIHVEAEYRLKNSGNQPLSRLEVRMPGLRTHAANLVVSWDGEPLPTNRSENNRRDTLLQIPQTWSVSAEHSLRIVYDIRDLESSSRGLRFTKDAFFLPQQSWAPELLPPRGFLGEGGVPPNKWNLAVTVPRDFRLHMSGKVAKRSRKRGEAIFRSQQRPQDRYPFIVAGRYRETQIKVGSRTVHLWTRAKPDLATVRETSESLVRSLGAYDSIFGVRGKGPQPLWIVECPEVEGCFTGRNAPYAKLLGLPPDTSTAEVISLDTVLVGLRGSDTRMVVAAAPFLAASWLGYGRNPGFFEQQPPLSALPIFAAAIGRESVEGPGAREEMIRKALSDVPVRSPKKTRETRSAVRAKSFLFFFALQDRYGDEVFKKAIQHMLYARQGRGFDLDDMIAAFEEETHQNVAAFVRLWMKHPGVPQDFRDRYEAKTAAAANIRKENTP